MTSGLVPATTNTFIPGTESYRIYIPYPRASFIIDDVESIRMDDPIIIVRYGEIGLKSQQTRRVMEKRLVDNIRAVVGDKRIRRAPGRIFVESDCGKHAKRISRLFGVVSTSLAVKISSELDSLLKAGSVYAGERLDSSKKFAVRARRTGSHTYKSTDVAMKLGAVIAQQTGAKVDLEDPDVTIYVEVRDKDAYISDNVIKGVGGMPLGTQGKAVALVSGGIDSPVAAWMMMKRGVEIVALFMDCRPLVDSRTIDRAMATVRVLSTWTNSPIKTMVAPYGDALIEFLKYGDHKLGCVLCKRLMIKVAERIAGEEKALGIVTGDSLGQVASQTLQNMYTIEEGIGLPIFRPLIGMDKTEIVDLAKMIGSYEASIQPANCCLGPPLHPETKATIAKVAYAEKSLEMEEMVEKSLAGIRILEVSHEEG
jgi:thiamine biosynthesis protein ThiI